MERSEFKDRIVQHVRKITGLVLSPVQEKSIEKAIERGEISPDVLEERNPFSLRFQRLLKFITVEESYFFRYPKQYELLKKLFERELIPRARKESRRISILSLGCARGEELYSALMVIERVLESAPDVSVVGVGADINLEYLDVAQKGIYTNSSLRLLSEEEKRKYFIKDGFRYILRKNFRSQVYCFPVNVVDWKTYPLVYAPYDVVFFRNVLIYIAPEFQKRVMKNILQLILREGGYLFMGHADFVSDDVPLERAFQDNVYVFAPRSDTKATRHRKRVSHALEKKEPEISQSRVVSKKEHHQAGIQEDRVKELLAKGNLRAIERLINQFKENGSSEAMLKFLKSWVWVNRGESEKARQELEQLAENGVLMPEVYYLLGYIHFEKGDLILAMRELQKAVYLKDNFIPAHKLLLTIYEKLNRQKDMRRTARILEAFEKGELVPEWGLVPPGE